MNTTNTDSFYGSYFTLMVEKTCDEFHRKRKEITVASVADHIFQHEVTPDQQKILNKKNFKYSVKRRLHILVRFKYLSVEKITSPWNTQILCFKKITA